MKKSIPLLLLLLMATTSVLSQHRQKFGINAGLNYSKFRGMDLPGVDYSYASGMLVGLSYEYYLKENLSIKANISYDVKKSNGEADFQLRQTPDNAPIQFTETVTYTYNYMTLPVMLKYDFRNAAGLFVNGGLFLGYLLDSEAKGKANTNAIMALTDFSTSTKEFNNKFDFGLALGVGKTFQLKNKNSLVIELRNSLGLSQTNKNNTFDGNTVRSNSYALIVGWASDM